MKRTKLLAGCLALVATVLVGLGLAGGVSATSFRTGNQPSVSADEVVDSSLQIAGNSVSVKGQINGDVFCAGQSVTVEANVKNDVLCAGATVTINGTIDGDIRAAGQVVTINGEVKGNVTAFGSEINLGKSAKIGGDVTVAGNVLQLQGSIGRDLVASGGVITLNGTQIKRDANLTSEDIRFEAGAKIGRALDYTRSSAQNIPEGVVAGSTNFHESAQRKNEPWVALKSLATMALSLIVSWLVIALALPQQLASATRRANANPGRTFFAGLFMVFLAPIAAFILVLTLFGFLAGMVVLVGWVLTLLVSGAFAAFSLGRLIIAKSNNVMTTMLVGSVVLAILFVMPYVGILALLASLVYGSGIAVSGFFQPLNYRLEPVTANPEPPKDTPTTKPKRGKKEDK